MTVSLRPIGQADVEAVAQFLQQSMTPAVPAERWVEAIDVPWAFERPNLGFMLVDGDSVVGTYLAYYSERIEGGRPQRYCNLGSWSVSPAYRPHSIKLLRALLSQQGYLFTDFTPDRTVIEINRRLGFDWFGGRAAVVPNLPWLPRRGGPAVTSDPAEIEALLSGRELRIHRDHAGPEGILGVVLFSDDQRCHLIFRRRRRMGLPVALLLHASDADLLRRGRGALSRHLLLRHGIVAQLIEERIAGSLPPLRVGVHAPRRMIRGGDPEAVGVDYLYSELTRLSW